MNSHTVQVICLYKLVVKLDGVKPAISRTVYVARNITFTDLDAILRTVFSFTYAHLSVFGFDGLNTRMWDFNRCMPDELSAPMDVKITDYLELFKSFSWTYDLNKSYTFKIKVRKPDKKLIRDWPFVEGYEGIYDPIEDRHPADFEEMIYYAENGLEMPDWLSNFEMEYFDIGEVNGRLKDL